MQIVKAFGEAILTEDKKIDRPKLREIVFKNKTEKKKLERIMHWGIFKSIFARIREIFSDSSNAYAVLDAPLLYETGILEWICYPVVVMYIGDKDLWLKRLMDRDHCTKEEALVKMSNQMPIEKKLKKAEIVINNMGKPEDVYTEFVKKFFQFINL